MAPEERAADNSNHVFKSGHIQFNVGRRLTLLHCVAHLMLKTAHFFGAKPVLGMGISEHQKLLQVLDHPLFWCETSFGNGRW